MLTYNGVRIHSQSMVVAQLFLTRWNYLSLLFKTRNSSGDEIANVNFLYDDIVHAQENTIDSCINSATDRFLQRRYTKFNEIPQ